MLQRRRRPGGGRKAKPDALKALQGNPGKRRRKPDPAPLAEGSLQPVGIAALPVPEPPPYLSSEAVAEWRRMAADMVKLGLLRRLDLVAFEARCELYATWRQCRATIAKEGVTYTHKGVLRPRPEVGLAQDCLRQIRQYDSDFGLTPAARARVAHVTGDGQQPRLPLGDKPLADPDKAAPGWTDEQFFRGPAH